ncbi:unnamed protein product [Soboliphyme baturini]|uniref:protein acetyllysine N-acetyltransferase n=1 Tax=Soboliphyme baturini TaxID=241478 RepID=A0A183IXS3_9BILA|nr:unnamed protein product [Soboliphyme baturini]
MSVNYAANLSPYDNKGKCGAPETLSTAFRGPNGVWTLEKKGQNPNVNVRFEDAIPTFTHLALVALEKAGYVKFLVTQNVDGLHLRSGYPRDRMSELHGNVFVEHCPVCKVNHIRLKTVPTIGRKFTGNICEWKKRSGHICRGKLRDTVLDWEDSLPTFDLTLAEYHSKLADLSVCLGSTLQIVPAGNLPTLAGKTGGKLAIVNLQATKQDNKADLIIHARVDAVMQVIMKSFGIEVADGKTADMVLRSSNGSPEMPPGLMPAVYSSFTSRGTDRQMPWKRADNVTRHELLVIQDEPLPKLLKTD